MNQGFILRILVAAFFLMGCGDALPKAKAPSNNAAAAVASARTEREELLHASLKRVRYELSLSAPPVVRFRCTVKVGRDQKTVEWDPQAPNGLTYSVFVRPSKGDTQPVICGSETLSVGRKDEVADVYQYVGGEVPPSTEAAAKKTLTYQLRSVLPQRALAPASASASAPAPGSAASTNPAHATAEAPGGVLVVTYTSETQDVALEHLLGEGTAIAHTRSFEALTPIVGDLAAVATSVALDRAKRAGARLLGRTLTDRFCNQLTEGNFSQFDFGQKLGFLSESSTPLFPLTCDLLRTTPPETLVAVPRMLARTMAFDLSGLLLRGLSRSTGVVNAELIVELRSAVLALMEGRHLDGARLAVAALASCAYRRLSGRRGQLRPRARSLPRQAGSRGRPPPRRGVRARGRM